MDGTTSTDERDVSAVSGRLHPAVQRTGRIGAVVAGVILSLSAAGGSGPALAALLDPVDPAEQQRVLAQIDSVGRRGFLYEVSAPASSTDEPRHLFLYGTIHLGRVGSEPFNPAVVTALRRSRRLALEADPTDEATTRRLALQLGRYADGDDLRHHLPAPLMARVRAFGERNGIAAADLVRFKPWLLANMVTLRDFGDIGLDPALGSELYLSGYARARRMPIVEIEGIETQLRMLAGLPDAMQAAQLDEALQDLDGHADTDGAGSGERHDGSDVHEGRALFELWLRGDAAAGNALVDELHRDAAAKPFARYFVETLIDERDRTMADQAERDLALPGATFFAVGALHLFGRAGLLAELTRRGYRVVDLQ